MLHEGGRGTPWFIGGDGPLTTFNRSHEAQELCDCATWKERMMEHVREERLALYASGDLAPREDSGLGAHLRSFWQCQRVLADFRNTRSFIESSLRDPEPEDLTQLRDRIATRLQQRSRWQTSDIRLR